MRVARDLVSRTRDLTRRADQLERDFAALVRARRPLLLTETGCGPLTAAILIGHTAGAEGFPTYRHFARLAGVAPIPVSSGRRDRHRLHRGGESQLDKALAHHRRHPRSARAQTPRGSIAERKIRP